LKTKLDLGYIPALTGVRAIAAYLVFFHHFNPMPVDTWFWRLLNEGHVGVTVFFVLSGFLIPLRYLNRVELSRHWLKRYFLNRFSRIYPTYALLTGITFLVIWRFPSFDPTGQWQGYASLDKVLVPLLNFSFLRGFFEQFKFTGVAQGWTLTVEECFYAFAPLLLVLLAKSRTKYGVLAACALGLGLFGCLLVQVAPHRYGFFGTYQFMFYRTFFGRVLEFMLGAGLALFIRQNPETRKGGWATYLGGLWILSSMFGLSLITTKQVASWDSPTGIVLNNLWLPFGIVLFFYGLLTERTWLCRLLESTMAQVLGKSSYAFYLVHVGVASVFLQRYVSSNVFVLFALALLLAFSLWKWIEEPVNHKLRALGK
jgi:peptidoglycan/LPS O-acetylase OafA/YrhL